MPGLENWGTGRYVVHNLGIERFRVRDDRECSPFQHSLWHAAPHDMTVHIAQCHALPGFTARQRGIDGDGCPFMLRRRAGRPVAIEG